MGIIDESDSKHQKRGLKTCFSSIKLQTLPYSTKNQHSVLSQKDRSVFQYIVFAIQPSRSCVSYIRRVRNSGLENQHHGGSHSNDSSSTDPQAGSIARESLRTTLALLVDVIEAARGTVVVIVLLALDCFLAAIKSEPANVISVVAKVELDSCSSVFAVGFKWSADCYDGVWSV